MSWRNKFFVDDSPSLKKTNQHWFNFRFAHSSFLWCLQPFNLYIIFMYISVSWKVPDNPEYPVNSPYTLFFWKKDIQYFEMGLQYRSRNEVKYYYITLFQLSLPWKLLLKISIYLANYHHDSRTSWWVLGFIPRIPVQLLFAATHSESDVSALKKKETKFFKMTIQCIAQKKVLYYWH